MKLNKEFPRKLYLDTKVLVNGNKKKPRDLNLEKHIELGKWVQDMINGESVESNIATVTLLPISVNLKLYI